ncbi:uncharacterized protein EI90DRAFT_1485956 [Cantharellus anzutake]|uniref:uncharacterized protein n=1 Tax=Cantharellus anzutake TaxID=1750568 RepID=UPI0019038BC3|nr:uncharacterized protein EI90DRAFT_1485956 [Cantharellus anzutake]KAF8328870.1 hypothetical protein EI90DRAFT_1485956 [Cantharellus anzutake]
MNECLQRSMGVYRLRTATHSISVNLIAACFFAPMAQEATFNLTLRASSPLWRWVNVNDNPSTRWKVHCPKQTASPWCDEQLAFFTGEQGAVAMLEFTGSAITVYGHTSRGMAWAVALDGVPGHSQQMAPHSQVLALFSGLSPDCPHYLSIWTTAAPPKSYMRLDRAEITVGTGTPG